MSAPFGLTERVWEDFLRGLTRGDYRLLLGAGASVEATDKHGRVLPTSPALSAEIVSDFAVEVGDEVLSLQRAYRRVSARGRLTSQQENIVQYFGRRFVGCVPPAWYNSLVHIRWASIWTLNIDDVLENAYVAHATIDTPPLRSVTWTDRFRYPTPDNVETICVHLHGYAKRATADSGFVFDLAEYLSAVTKVHSWHAVIRDEFFQHPFLVLGAKLADEIDLFQILSQGNHADRPSIAVLRSITPSQREELEDFGLIPVEASAGDFVAAIHRDIGPYASEFTSQLPKGGSVRQGVQFLRQFSMLRTSSTQSARRSADDFYLGYEPQWVDIVSGRDAIFTAVEDGLKVLASRSDSCPTLLALFGSPFTGKSTSLYRLARELISLGWDAYLLETTDRIDIQAAVSWLRNAPKSAFVIDNLADHASDVADLLTIADKEGFQLVVLAAERDSRRALILDSIPPSYLVNLRAAGLNDRNIRALTAKLEAAHRLGVLENTRRAEQFKYFRETHGRDLFSGLEGLEHGRGFSSRLVDFLSGLKDSRRRDCFLLACISQALGYALPVSTLAKACGMPSDALVKEITREGGDLHEYLQLERNRVKVASRRLASVTLERAITSEERYSLTLELARVLAPFVTPKSISQRALPYRITAELMKFRLTNTWLHDRSISWYEELEDTFSWDGRYWEQRALALSAYSFHEPAESYSRHAVGILEDAYSLNTLGTVLLRRATLDAPVGSSMALRYYWEGVEILRKAARRGQRENMHPYITFFRYTLSGVRAGAISHRDGEILDEWNRWMEDAHNVQVFTHEELRTDLDETASQWLRTVTMGAGPNADVASRMGALQDL